MERIAKSLNVNLTDYLKRALLGFHAFTGNDYISLFFTKEKAISWKKMIKNESFINGFQEFGLSLEILNLYAVYMLSVVLYSFNTL